MQISFKNNDLININKDKVKPKAQLDWVYRDVLSCNKELVNETNKKLKFSIPAILYLAGSLLIFKNTICSAFPRILGVRLESHSTSKAVAKKITENNCVLDPKYGGTGASVTMNYYKNISENFIHITGLHNDFKLYKNANPFTKTLFSVYSSLYKKLQQPMYRGLSSYPIHPDTIDSKKPFLLFDRIFKGVFCGKTFYIPGTDEYFKTKFISDEDDIALKTKDTVKVYTSRFKAVLAHVNEHGLINSIKNSKSKVAIGIALAIGGFSSSYLLAKKAYESFRVS